jgi:hypothetical protein
MTTVLIFAGIPLAVIATIVLLTFGVGARRAVRYRPGRPFPFAPVWFVSASAPGGSVGDPSELPALTSTERQADPATIRPAGKKGGARGTW